MNILLRLFLRRKVFFESSVDLEEFVRRRVGRQGKESSKRWAECSERAKRGRGQAGSRFKSH